MIHEWPDQGKRVPRAETTVTAPNKAAKEKFFLTEIQTKINIDKKVEEYQNTDKSENKATRILQFS